MNKEASLNDKVITKTPDQTDNDFILSKPRQEIELLVIKKTGKV